MFSRCIACNADLGRNEMLDRFPVGRRLAFDAAKGRLWVVCPSCKQWNLSPLEERWEAIEAAERLYHDARKRVTTDEVGLARMADGTDLVRIGEPKRPEFAAWRYGARLVARRTKYILAATGAAVAGGTILIGGVAAGVVAGGAAGQIPNLINATRALYRRLWVVARVEDAQGDAHLVTAATLRRAGLVTTNEAAWALEVPRLPVAAGWRARLAVKPDEAPAFRLEGDAARRLMARVLPHVNASGASKDDVQRAVQQLERGDSLDSLSHLAARLPPPPAKGGWGKKTVPPRAALGEIPVIHRLALEMALHEDDERRWLEGELDDLADRWREAEEVAAIADRLLLPGWVEARIGRGDRDP
jgi:hypothetical protein